MVQKDVLDKVLEENKRLSKRVKDLEESVFYIENDINEIERYTRRNNMEIYGIPANIDPSKLEETVINISKKIDIDIKSEDMEACHRSRRKGNTNSVIIRFVNRKFAERLQASKKKLK